MTKRSVKPTAVIEQDLALKVYIDSLLFEDLQLETEQDVEQEVESRVETVTEIPVVVTPAPLVTTPEPVPVVAVEPQVEAKTETVLEVEPPVDVVDVVQETVVSEPVLAESVPAPVPAQAQAVVPEWAQGEFESLVFQVAGFLKLAVPLVKLNGIIHWSDEITSVPGHEDWFIGLLPVRGKQVKVIDLARFVIPKHHKARMSLSERPQFTHIVLVGDGEWGLACDNVEDVLKTSAEKVKWREARFESRPWLAGTVKEEMFALLDVESFVLALKDGGTLDEICN